MQETSSNFATTNIVPELKKLYGPCPSTLSSDLIIIENHMQGLIEGWPGTSLHPGTKMC